MKQYQDLMAEVFAKGTPKKDRTGTGTLSIFGHQMRFNLQEGFPLVTTKRCHLRSIIHELLWFLKGDTNVKYLNDNGVTIWDEWKNKDGDLGPVYGKQWRAWTAHDEVHTGNKKIIAEMEEDGWEEAGYREASMLLTKDIDQIAKVMDQLKNDPDNRRIIVSAWNVADLDDMALAPCHAFFQFYTREMSLDERVQWAEENDNELWSDYIHATFVDENTRLGWLDKAGVPTRKLSCQLYQRKLNCAF